MLLGEVVPEYAVRLSWFLVVEVAAPWCWAVRRWHGGCARVVCIARGSVGSEAVALLSEGHYHGTQEEQDDEETPLSHFV